MFDDDPIVGNERQCDVLQRLKLSHERKQLVDTADLVAVGTIATRDTTGSNGTTDSFRSFAGGTAAQNRPTPA